MLLANDYGKIIHAKMKKKEIKKFDLDKPFNPADIKGLNEEELEQLSADIRKKIVTSCAKNGGHLSASLGATDLIVAIHHYFDLPKDKVIFDVGHQCYAHKILSGRSLDNLRQEDGVSGFQKRNESEYDPYEAGHSSTSISAAMGMAAARDMNKEDYNVIAVIGDASLANGLAYEAINNLGTFNHKIILIINDNNQSIGKAVGYSSNGWEKFRLSRGYLKRKERYVRFMKKTAFGRGIYKASSAVKNFFKYVVTRQNTFQNMGIYYISNIDGHDIAALEKAFKYAKNAPSSVAIHVTTIKGKGYEYAEKDVAGNWHGVGPFNIETGEPLKKLNENEISWSGVYADLVDTYMQKDEKMVVINPATVIGSHLCHVFEKYPERTYDVGISEEHAAVFASGMAVSGLHPYISAYSTFLQRSYDEISHDIARMDANVTMLVDRVGLPGTDGETHEGIFDVAYLNTIPNVAICMAKDQNQAKDLFAFSSSYAHPLAVRYPRGKTIKQEEREPQEIKLGQWCIENNGDDTVIITYGSVVDDVVKAFNKHTVVNAIFQKPIDVELLKTLLNKKQIAIYDIYGTEEGFASIVKDELNKLSYKGLTKTLCVPSSFVKHGSIDGQIKALNISLENLKAII